MELWLLFWINISNDKKYISWSKFLETMGGRNYILTGYQSPTAENLAISIPDKGCKEYQSNHKSFKKVGAKCWITFRWLTLFTQTISIPLNPNPHLHPIMSWRKAVRIVCTVLNCIAFINPIPFKLAPSWDTLLIYLYNSRHGSESE